MTEKIGKSETEAWAQEMLVCRQIVDEIYRFGVNQKQTLNIIKLLAMQLENHEAMVAISAVVKEALEEVQIPSNIITTE